MFGELKGAQSNPKGDVRVTAIEVTNNHSTLKNNKNNPKRDRTDSVIWFKVHGIKRISSGSKSSLGREQKGWDAVLSNLGHLAVYPKFPASMEKENMSV